jgi:hypothetical protein
VLDRTPRSDCAPVLSCVDEKKQLAFWDAKARAWPFLQLGTLHASEFADISFVFALCRRLEIWHRAQHCVWTRWQPLDVSGLRVRAFSPHLLLLSRSIAKHKGGLLSTEGTTRRLLQYSGSQWQEQTVQPDGKPQLSVASAAHVLVLDKRGLALHLQTAASGGVCLLSHWQRIAVASRAESCGLPVFTARTWLQLPAVAGGGLVSASIGADGDIW